MPKRVAYWVVVRILVVLILGNTEEYQELILSSTRANTLTFLFENEYNETTTMAECRNSIDKIMMQPNGLLNYIVFSGKLLNNMGDMESC